MSIIWIEATDQNIEGKRLWDGDGIAAAYFGRALNKVIYGEDVECIQGAFPDKARFT